MIDDRSQPTLAGLVRPTTIAEFYSQYWECRPLLTRSSHEIRFSFADLDSMLVHMQFRAGNLRIVGDGADQIPADPLTEISIDQIKAAFTVGNSIVIRECHRYLPELRKLVQCLESELTHAIMANMYVTPPGCRAFAKHIDTHDVLVLQLDGCKRWRLFGSDTDLPLAESSTEPNNADNLTLEVDLEPGDVLYVPRGFAHEVAALDSWSVHATVGIYVFRWVDLFVEAIRSKAIADPNLRRAFFISASRCDTQERQLRAALETSLSETDIMEAWSRLCARFDQWKKNANLGEMYDI